MFGRARSHQRTQEEAHRIEVQELRGQVARLEQALADVIAASDQVVDDMNRRRADVAPAAPLGAAGFEDAGFAGARFTDAGFAAAWTRIETQTSDADQFFTIDHVDQRARKWLLASS